MSSRSKDDEVDYLDLCGRRARSGCRCNAFSSYDRSQWRTVAEYPVIEVNTLLIGREGVAVCERVMYRCETRGTIKREL